MQPTHQSPVYGTGQNGPRDLAADLSGLAALHRQSKTATSLHGIGRNRLTRTIDTVLEFVRRYLPPVHWVAVRILALLLYGYARAVGATAKLVTVGSFRWPDVPKGSVLAIWHGSAPSLLAAFAARRPSMPLNLMVSRDSRGDCVALFCRWLGFEVVRGDAKHGGWRALVQIASEVHDGAAVLISPDVVDRLWLRGLGLSRWHRPSMHLLSQLERIAVLRSSSGTSGMTPAIRYHSGGLQWLVASLSRSHRLQTPLHSKEPASNCKTRSAALPEMREAPLALEGRIS